VSHEAAVASPWMGLWDYGSFGRNWRERPPFLHGSMRPRPRHLEAGGKNFVLKGMGDAWAGNGGSRQIRVGLLLDGERIPHVHAAIELVRVEVFGVQSVSAAIWTSRLSIGWQGTR